MRMLTFDAPGGVPDAFLDLPHAVYAGDPRWIPEARDATIRAFSREHDWFETGQAAGFCIPGHARLAVFRPASLSVNGRQAAVFGYWEQAVTSDATALLLDEAEAWARASGAEVLYGPIDFNTSRRYRLRLEAEPDAATFLGEPYNPAVYPPMLEAAGYRVARWYVSQIGMRQPVRVEHKERVRDAVVASGYSIETLDGGVWRENLADLKHLADAVFADNFAFWPESLATFAAGYGEAVARRLCPRSSLLVRDPAGAIVGFVLIYPNYGRLVAQHAGASRIAASELSFDEHCPMLERAGERTAVVRTVGVHPDYRALGVMDALMAEAVARGVHHYDRWIGALIEASNWSRRFGSSQTDHERTYALFAKDLTARQ
jgi:ribosomal protein S18 acetylase RimI-like enzyme